MPDRLRRRRRPSGPHGVRRRRVAAPSARAATANAATTPRSRHTSAVDGEVVRVLHRVGRRRTAGSRLLTACSTVGHRVARDEQAAQQDLRDHEQRHELHGLELGLRERADQEPERRAEDRVDDRDQPEQPDRADDVEPEHADAERDRERRLDRGDQAERDGVPDRGSRACPSASPAAARGCRELRSRRVVTEVTRNITMKGNIASSGRPEPVEEVAGQVLEHPPQQGDQHARQHQQHRDGTTVAAQLGEDPGGRPRAGSGRSSRVPLRDRAVDQGQEGALDVVGAGLLPDACRGCRRR